MASTCSADPSTPATNGHGVRYRVQGSARQPYDVEVRLEAGAALDAASTLAGWCSCPYGGGKPSYCEHVAAIVDLLVDDVGRGERPEALAPLARAVVGSGWQGLLEHLEATIARREKIDVGREAGELAWRVALDARGVRVAPVVRVRLKNGGMSKGRVISLAELVRTPSLRRTPQDARVASLVAALAGERATEWYVPEIRVPSLELLGLLAGHPRVEIEANGASIAIESAEPGLAIVRRAEGHFALLPAMGGRPIDGDAAALVPGGFVVILAAEGRLLFGACGEEATALLAAVREAGARFPLEAAGALADRVLALAGLLPVAIPPELEGRPVPPDARLRLLVTPREEGGAALDVRVRPLPGGPALAPGAGPERLAATVGGERLLAVRDPAGEVAALESDGAITLAPPAAADPWRLAELGDDALLDLLAHLDTPRFSDVVVEWPEDTAPRRVTRVLPGSLRIELREKRDWFGIEGGLEVDGELWSLFQVLSPGLLGSWEGFAERFARPIEKDRDPARRAALARLVRPFILRRTKAEVAPELPARIEVRLDATLSKVERAIYEAERLRIVARLAGGGEDARFQVLAGLTRLRQLACHARLVDPAAPAVSAKQALLLDQLRDALEGGHRALVFSQFTRHLGLLRGALDDAGIRTLYLDGKTPAAERARLVERFQEREAPVFLISLKAGGTGLNLTAADYVFHMDPWWNPAVEDQAADRTHRIGQTRPVTIVRIVAAGTVEEKVLALHAEKRDLVAGVLEGTERAAKLSVRELISLFGAEARAAGESPKAAGEARAVVRVGERAAAREARAPATDATPSEGGSWDAALERFRRECARSLAASSAREYLGALARVAGETSLPAETAIGARLDALLARLLRRREIEPLGRRAMTTSALRKLVRFLAAEGTLAPKDVAGTEERLRRYRGG